LFAFDNQLNVMNHLFVFVYGELYFAAMIY
jgi:hypothetical protein